jgi:carbon-monoxide dehydrogenase medium subunit
VIPAPFDYVRPDSVDEAVRALGNAGEDGKVLAGGQSLIPILRLRLAAPEILVDLGGIPDLRGVRDDGDEIVVGAMTTHDEVMHHPLVLAHAPLLAQATATVGDRQVRHLGTFGGSVAHADPAGDLPTVALTLDAEMVVQGPSGVRRIPAAEFFQDYLTTALQPEDVLTAIRIPKLGNGWAVHYEKFNRVAQAWSGSQPPSGGLTGRSPRLGSGWRTWAALRCGRPEWSRPWPVAMPTPTACARRVS